VFDNTGASYQVLRAVDEKGLFNEATYKAYSPSYLSAGNAFVYGMFFAIYTSTITHTYLYNRHEIIADSRAWLAASPPSLAPRMSTPVS